MMTPLLALVLFWGCVLLLCAFSALFFLLFFYGFVLFCLVLFCSACRGM